MYREKECVCQVIYGAWGEICQEIFHYMDKVVIFFL